MARARQWGGTPSCGDAQSSDVTQENSPWVMGRGVDVGPSETPPGIGEAWGTLPKPGSECVQPINQFSPIISFSLPTLLHNPVLQQQWKEDYYRWSRGLAIKDGSNDLRGLGEREMAF